MVKFCMHTHNANIYVHYIIEGPTDVYCLPGLTQGWRKLFYTGRAIKDTVKRKSRSGYMHLAIVQSMLKLGGLGACPQENFEILDAL